MMAVMERTALLVCQVDYPVTMFEQVVGDTTAEDSVGARYCYFHN